MSVIRADARQLPFADGSVDLALCSPPYYAMREYGAADGEMGRPSSVRRASADTWTI